MEPEIVGPVVVALQVKKFSFLDEEIQLKKLSKELSKTSKEAVDVLVLMLKNTDDKIKMQAAIKLIELDVDVKKTISTEQMQRMIAEIKLNNGGNSRALEIEGSSVSNAPKINRPIVDFSSIRSIE